MLKSIPSLGPGWIEAWDEEKAMGIETHGIRTSGARENRLSLRAECCHAAALLCTKLS